MTGRRAWIIGLLAVICICGCGKASPTAPTPAAAAITGPRILLAGQSGAFFLSSYLPEAIDFS